MLKGRLFNLFYFSKHGLSTPLEAIIWIFLSHAERLIFKSNTLLCQIRFE